MVFLKGLQEISHKILIKCAFSVLLILYFLFKKTLTLSRFSTKTPAMSRQKPVVISRGVLLNAKHVQGYIHAPGGVMCSLLVYGLQAYMRGTC